MTTHCSRGGVMTNSTTNNNFDPNIQTNYSRIFEDERHFNQMQIPIRTIASAWLLASFSGIGYLFKNNIVSELSSDVYFLVSIVALMGSVGLGVLYMIDQLVYQRLISASFIVGLQMEYDYPYLPPTRATSAMITLKTSNYGIPQIMKHYYFVPSLFLLLISVFCSYMHFSNNSNKLFGFYIILNVLVVCFLCFLNRKSGKGSPPEIPEILPETDFKKLIKNKKFNLILERHEQYKSSICVNNTSSQ